jgi:hypothetical protein
VHVQFWRCCFVSYRLNADAPSLGSQKVCERSPGSSAGARAFQARLVVGEVAQDVGHHVPGDRGQGMSGVFAFPGVLNLGVIRWAYTVEGRLLETLAKGLIVRVPALPAGCAKAWPRPGRCARQDRDLPRPLGQLEVLGQCTAGAPRMRGRARSPRRNSSAASATTCTSQPYLSHSNGTCQPGSRPSPRYVRGGRRMAGTPVALTEIPLP